MPIWDWENFQEVLTSGNYRIVDTGPLHGPINSFHIGRDEQLRIVLTTFSDGDATAPPNNIVEGQLRINTDSIKFESLFGSIVLGVGVTSLNHTVHRNHKTGTSSTEERSIIHSLERNSQITPAEMTIDWVINLDDSLLHWPHSKSTKTTEIEILHHREWGEEFNLSSEVKHHSIGHSCLHLTIDGIEFAVGTCKTAAEPKLKAGYILYKGEVPQSQRSKIMDCVSFALGVCLIPIGYATFNRDGRPNAFKAIAGYTQKGQVFSMNTLPPAPLGFQYIHEVDPAVIHRMVAGLYKNYETLNLKSLFWGYWHARTAPVHIAAVHYGALIEALQKQFTEHADDKSISKIVEKEEWALLKSGLVAALKESGIQGMTHQIFLEHIHNLNRVPQKIFMQRFLAKVGIALGEHELRAWQQRNHAAHGNEIVGDGYTQTIRETKLLMAVFHRMLLKITNSTDYYFDYFTLGFPKRLLSEPAS
ncbi:hypothetical protein [Pseudomonas silesiensis]|uniref:hypothetical protein n=1 Tax=Pseudomonas silesiensis TaxID=1853130 RepID=UPI0034D41DED